MKKILYAIEFLFVLVFFVLPPVFVKPFSGVTQVNLGLSLNNILLLAVSLSLFFTNKKLYDSRYFAEGVPHTARNVAGLTGLGGLLAVALVMQFLSYTALRLGFETVQSEAALPQSFIQGLSAAACIISAAISEEIIYRFYLPDFPVMMCEGKFRIFFEAAAVILFAAGHVYQGVFGVMNGLFCGLILRWIMLKTQSLWFTTLIHCLFNCFIFICSAVL